MKLNSYFLPEYNTEINQSVKKENDRFQVFLCLNTTLSYNIKHMSTYAENAMKKMHMLFQTSNFLMHQNINEL